MNNIKNSIDPEILKIEKEIVEYLVKSPLFMGEDLILSTIRAYFITRKELTQKEIQHLTNYSAGTVSQALKALINRGYLEKTRPSSTTKIIYRMDSIELSFLNSFLEGFGEIESWKKVIQELKSEMENNKEKLHELNGYEAISDIMNLFFNSVASIGFIIEMISQEKNKLEKEFGK